MTRHLIAILIVMATAMFVTSSCAYAQVNALGGATANSGIGGAASPNFGIGTTSPLGMSTSGTAGAPTGVPLGATPLATPGVSSGSSNGVASSTACSSPGMGNAMTGTSSSTALFDNSGVGIMTGATLPGSAGAVTTTCGPALATGGATSLQSSASTPATSRPGIPMGSTELSNPGLSPAPCPATGNISSTSSGAC
jgi:hypothetical protein